MTHAEELFFEIARQFPGLKLSKMFGSPCLKTPDGKSAAMFWKDCIVVKLSEAQLKEALKLEGVQFFAPMEGRLMKEWVQIPYSRNNDWEKFINLSSGYVMQEGKNSNKKPPKQKR